MGPRWDGKELERLARLEASLRLKNVVDINQVLFQKSPSRTLSSIRGIRRKKFYLDRVKRVMKELKPSLVLPINQLGTANSTVCKMPPQLDTSEKSNSESSITLDPDVSQEIPSKSDICNYSEDETSAGPSTSGQSRLPNESSFNPVISTVNHTIAPVVASETGVPVVVLGDAFIVTKNIRWTPHYVPFMGFTFLEQVLRSRRILTPPPTPTSSEPMSSVLATGSDTLPTVPEVLDSTEVFNHGDTSQSFFTSTPCTSSVMAPAGPRLPVMYSPISSPEVVETETLEIDDLYLNIAKAEIELRPPGPLRSQFINKLIANQIGMDLSKVVLLRKRLAYHKVLKAVQRQSKQQRQDSLKIKIRYNPKVHQLCKKVQSNSHEEKPLLANITHEEGSGAVNCSDSEMHLRTS